MTEVPENLPRIHTDAALLERAIANVIDNAVTLLAARARPSAFRRRRSGTRSSCGSSTGVRGSRPTSGSGSSNPFSAWATSTPGTGVGLGLAVARGFVDALGGELTVDDTAGGGTTITFILKAAP